MEAELAAHSALDAAITKAFLEGDLMELRVILPAESMRIYKKKGAYVDVEGMELVVSIVTSWRRVGGSDEDGE